MSNKSRKRACALFFFHAQQDQARACGTTVPSCHLIYHTRLVWARGMMFSQKKKKRRAKRPRPGKTKKNLMSLLFCLVSLLAYFSALHKRYTITIAALTFATLLFNYYY
ncbi:hypothetical protein BC940DRAFT_293219 [Gongronella butleri]|nr:hypothetical protein BC940DRAFT_293219 [Gongronella butleri]